MITRISVDDKAVRAVIDALPKNIFNAEKSAVQQTTRWAKKEVQNRLIAKTGIPPRVFRRFRVKSKRLNYNGGLVWVGINQVKASYVGKLKQDITGASAGSYFFQGGFVAKMQSGHVGIFKRRGQARLPLDEQTVRLFDAGMIVSEQVAQEAGEKLKQSFIEKVIELNPHLE